MAGRYSRSHGQSGTAPPPQATCCLLELPPPPIFAIQEAMKTLKGHQGVRDTVATPRAWPEPV